MSAEIKQVFLYFKEWGDRIEPQLEKFFQDQAKNPYCEDDFGLPVLESISDLTLRGGKRQRVAFIAAAYKLLNGELTPEKLQSIVDVAIAVELLQTQLLIHDDLIDEAPFRRGGTTINKEFRDEATESDYVGDKKKYGDSVAVLAGDLAAYFACYPIINSANIPAEQKIRILDILLLSGIDTFYGQLLDLYRDALQTTSEEEILKLAFVKAGRSSADAPLFLGAVLADSDSPEILAKLAAYSKPASIAAQLQDDILGVFGEEEKLGKSVLSDLAQGKQTLLVLFARSKANEQQLETLNTLIGKTDITHEEAEIVKQIIIDTGALEYTKNVALEYIKQAQAAMETWDEQWNEDAKNFFAVLLIAAINREY